MKNYIYKAWQIHRIKSVGIFFILLQSLLFSATFYVNQNDSNGDDLGPCSQANPCITIQVAIDKTSDEDKVIVSVGNYVENLIIETGITLQSADSDNPATIDGSSATDDFGSCINIRENASKGTSRGTVEIEGMILTGGRGTTVKIDAAGDGYDESDPADNINVGGGIRSQNVNLVSKKNKIIDNGTTGSIDEGGGVYSGDAPDIGQNDPQTPPEGNDNNPREEMIITFEETEFSRNQAYMGGAGVFVGGDSNDNNLSLNFDHVTVADNYGGGIYASHFVPGDFITITNSILWDNYPSSFDVYAEGQGPYINFTYNDIDLEHVTGQGNINLDPLFVNPEEGDFTLQESSPCIDAGDPESGWDPDGTDPDMGAYYYDQGTHVCEEGYVVDCSGDGDCCPELWIGDGFEDCEDQAYGCDLTCYDNDGGDCGGSSDPYCGDGDCDDDETPNSCPEDCSSSCDGGDVNGDGILNILDVVMIVNAVLGNVESDICMDANGDGIINVLDIVVLVTIILG